MRAVTPPSVICTARLFETRVAIMLARAYDRLTEMEVAKLARRLANLERDARRWRRLVLNLNPNISSFYQITLANRKREHARLVRDIDAWTCRLAYILGCERDSIGLKVVLRDGDVDDCLRSNHFVTQYSQLRVTMEAP